MRNETKEQIIKLASALIQEKGFSTFSYDDIAKPLQITKAAVHYHFETKEDLGIAVCEKVSEGMHILYERNVLKIKQQDGTPWGFIEDILEMIKPNQNCPISSLQSDFETLSGKFQEKIKEVSQLQISLFVQLVQEVSPQAEEERITILFLSIKSALQYRRILGEEFFRKSIQEVKLQMEQEFAF